MKIKIRMDIKKSTGITETKFFDCIPGDTINICDPEKDDVVRIELVKLRRSLFYRLFGRFFKMKMNIVLNTKPNPVSGKVGT